MCIPLFTLYYISCLTGIGSGGNSLQRYAWGHYDDLLTILDVVDSASVGSLEEAMLFGVI